MLQNVKIWQKSQSMLKSEKNVLSYLDNQTFLIRGKLKYAAILIYSILLPLLNLIL